MLQTSTLSKTTDSLTGSLYDWLFCNRAQEFNSDKKYSCLGIQSPTGVCSFNPFTPRK